MTGWAAAIQTNAAVKPLNYALAQQVAQRTLAAPDPAISPQTLAKQVVAWGNVGGNELMNHISSDLSQYVATRREQAGHPSQQTWPGVHHWAYPACARFSQIARIAYDYFRIPDPLAQKSWYRVMSFAWAGGQDCEHGIERRDSRLFGMGLRLLDEVGPNYQQARARIDAVKQASAEVR